MEAHGIRRALVAGSAACLWDDVKAARALCTFDRVYCVKMTGIHWPERFDTWITLHPEYMDAYEAQRAALSLPNGYEIVAPPAKEVGQHGDKGNISRRVSYCWPGMNASASSGIYAAKVALDDGYSRIVLAGIPMDDSKHFSRGKPWTQRNAFMRGFEQSIPYLIGRVKSMSGHTRQVLGAPSPEWLQGE
jgi:hypothetical protein